MDHRRRKVGARRSSRIALVGMVAALAVAGAVGVQPPAFASTVTVSLAPAGASSAPQGSPFFFKATLQNVGPSSQTVTVVFELIDQTASSVQFSSWTGTIAAGATKTVNGRVISSQFFAPLGTYLIQALDGQVPSGSPLSYTVTAAPVTVPTFQDVTSASGLATTLPATSICPEEAVIGAAWADVNGDGYLDLFQPVPLGPSQLWINDGTGHFTDQATSRGVDDLGRIAVGTTFADYDNDGDPDLYVVNNGPNQLFQNDGAGHFTDVTLTSGVGDAGVGPSAAWGDFNNDGHLDLFVANHAQCAVNQSDTLYMNNGDGTFANVTSYLLSGGPGLGDGFAAAWFDYNGDGRQDLYIANDDLGNLPNQLFRNDGPGPLGTWTFTDVSTQSHANYLVASMGIAVGDYNRDMKLDFAVSNIGGNVLAKNNGNGTFTNVAAAAGAKRATESDGVNAVTWGMGFYDLNLDGFLRPVDAERRVRPGVGAGRGVRRLRPGRADGPVRGEHERLPAPVPQRHAARKRPLARGAAGGNGFEP